jgi:hypothetical protein
METKGVRLEEMKKCLGSDQGSNWAVEPLVVAVETFRYSNNVSALSSSVVSDIVKM